MEERREDCILRGILRSPLLRGGLVLLSLCVVSLANSVCVCLKTCFTIFYPILYSE